MPSTVRVRISETLLWKHTMTYGSEMNAPGVMDRLARRMTKYGESIAPVGDVGDAGSRNWVVGTYKKSFGWERVPGGNQWQISRRIYNTAPHAYYVEFGRGMSFGYERFTSKGRWYRALGGTGGWEGHYVFQQISRTAGALL
jgi:hypothetical protein